MRIADLCCGAGGAAMGLHQAFPDADITGYDVADQPRYPFRFVKQDAMTVNLEPFDFVWASWPCQSYSRTRTLPGRSASSAAYASLVESGRAKLLAWGGPWIVENVEGAPLLNGVTLCGQMFGLPLFRHRLFESNGLLLAPPHPRHTEVINASSVSGKKAAYYGNTPGKVVTVAGHLFGLEAGKVAMGIDWMQKGELAQAVPPAYSRYLAQFIPVALPVETERAA